MSIAVLLSIKPNFALSIFSGEKKYEFRKTVYRDLNIDKIYVYASAPISKVIGIFSVEKIITHNPADLWQETCHAAGISEDHFHDYFAGKTLAHALKVKNAELFQESQSLSEMFGIKHPPQSFRYVKLNPNDF